MGISSSIGVFSIYRPSIKPEFKFVKFLFLKFVYAPTRIRSGIAVWSSIARFPGDPREQEVCGVPWGVTLVPFAAKDENGIPPVFGSGGELLPRCNNCWGYYNTYFEQDQWSWECSLCGIDNGLSTA